MNITVCYILTYVVEALLVYFYADFLFDKKRKLCRTVLYFVVFYTVLYFAFSKQSMALNAALYTLGNLLLLLSNYRCSLKQGVLHALFLSSTLLLSEYLTAVLIGALSGDIFTYNTDVSAAVAMLLISKLIYLLLTSVGARIFARGKLLDESPKITVLFCSMPVLSLGLALLSIRITSDYEVSQEIAQIIAVCVGSLMGVNLLFLILYNYMKKENAEKLFLRVAMEKEKAEAAYYQALHEEKENRSVLLHDIKNHLSAIAGLSAQGKNAEVSAYISDIMTDLASGDAILRYNDPILDLILYRISGECKKYGIRFAYDIRDCCNDYLDPPEKTALFSNLLSNGVEGAKDSAEKYIDFSIRPGAEGKGLVITTENSCDRKPITDRRGRYKTQKENPRIHGLGLRSIAQIVENRKGHSTVAYDEESHKFHHVIYLPNPKGER